MATPANATVGIGLLLRSSCQRADVTDGSTVHLVMRPVDTSAPLPPTGGAAGAHHFAAHMGGGIPIAFRGGPDGGLDPNDFGSVRISTLTIGTMHACEVSDGYAEEV